MALYKDGNPVSGLNSIPRLTLAQYNALNVKPEFWVRTDAPESYKKLSADQVSYDSNNTVKDKIDEKTDYIGNISSVTENIISCGSGETVSYTTTAKGWYRAVIINTGGSDVSLRVNGKSFAYLNVQGRYEMIVPLDSGVSLVATVAGNGAIYLNKFNF